MQAARVGEAVQPAERDPAPVEELADDEPSVRCEDSHGLAKDTVGFGDLSERGDQVDGVEGVIAERELAGVRIPPVGTDAVGGSGLVTGQRADGQ
jgi:hypothetical protein